MKLSVTLVVGELSESFPSRERGLKFCSGRLYCRANRVVPFAGTWIEILRIDMEPSKVGWSFPSRERGLKFVDKCPPVRRGGSFPSRERGLKSFLLGISQRKYTVVPFAGTWIEIAINKFCFSFGNVVPFAGTWIEISFLFGVGPFQSVVPFAGTWIEIAEACETLCLAAVVPFAGTWIEIAFQEVNCSQPTPSFPSRERGLKYLKYYSLAVPGQVVPFAGTWIEMDRRKRLWPWPPSSFPSRERGLKFPMSLHVSTFFRRSLRGNVD